MTIAHTDIRVDETSTPGFITWRSCVDGEVYVEIDGGVALHGQGDALANLLESMALGVRETHRPTRWCPRHTNQPILHTDEGDYCPRCEAVVEGMPF